MKRHGIATAGCERLIDFAATNAPAYISLRTYENILERGYSPAERECIVGILPGRRRRAKNAFRGTVSSANILENCRQDPGDISE